MNHSYDFIVACFEERKQNTKVGRDHESLLRFHRRLLRGAETSSISPNTLYKMRIC
jgi:hypothetical protein